jgi:hypothetical protein
MDILFAASIGSVIAMALGGIVAVIGVSAVFYVIGRGEDRDRARPPPAPPPDPPPPERARHARPRRRR